MSSGQVSLTASAIEVAERMLRQAELDMKIAPYILSSEEELRQSPFPQRANTVRSARAARLWRSQGRQTLVMHPEVVEASAAAKSDRIPGEVFRAIPYLNPMVVFAEPPELPTWRDTSRGHRDLPYGDRESGLRLLGFFTFGTVDQLVMDGDRMWDLAPKEWDVLRYDDASKVRKTLKGKKAVELPFRKQGDFIDRTVNVVSTHDESATRFGMVAMTEVVDAEGRKLDFETTSFSMDFSADGTIEELALEQSRRFEFATGSVEGMQAEYIENMFRYILGSLMYLASTTIDAEKIPARATSELGKRTMAKKPLAMYRLGWTIGEKISKYRREHPGFDTVPTGREQAPQHRRAHYRRVWTGPGRTIPKTVLVLPYWTHKDRLGARGNNTIRNVG